MNRALRSPDKIMSLINTVIDPGSWQCWDTAPINVATPNSGYADELAAARVVSGRDEAVITGEVAINGTRVTVIASEFRFLAGSIGVAAAERVVTAIDRATVEGLPLVALASSGGTRMQEGTVAFLQLVKISAALTRHKQAGLLYLVYLRHPTTGGVFASWGSLGHVTVAEPGALIGFLGPRVSESLQGRPFPAGIQTAENLHDHGLVDAVVGVNDLRPFLCRVLSVVVDGGARRGRYRDGGPPASSEPVPDLPAWRSVQRSRRPDRPGVRKLLQRAATNVTELRGSGEGEADSGLLLALAHVGQTSCVVLGQDALAQRAGSPLGPADLRTARRGMRIAAELGLPLLCVIDTPGAALSGAAEQAGLAGQIARCIAEMVTLPSPTLSLILGQGAGGAALALLPADRVLAAQHAWLAPLPPEGASAIMHRTTGRAAEVADEQGIRSTDLLRSHIVDRIVTERPDAADESDGAFLDRVARVLADELAALLAQPAESRHAARNRRYRDLGLGLD